MKITTITGKLKSDELTVTKAIGSLIIATSYTMEQLLNEKITIYIERGNGNNVILANKIPLKAFIMASTFGSEAVQSDGIFGCVALCEICQNGAIFLAEKESIKIQFDDLRALGTYEVYGVEEPVVSDHLFMFEQKTVASDDFNKKIDVKGFDLAIMSTSASVSDLSYQFANGQVVKYLPFELQTLSRDIDPIQAIDLYGSVLQSITGLLSLPLIHVDFIEINKAQGEIINFVVRTEKNVQ